MVVVTDSLIVTQLLLLEQGPPPLVYGLVCVDISQPDTSMSIGNRFFGK